MPHEDWGIHASSVESSQQSLVCDSLTQPHERSSQFRRDLKREIGVLCFCACPVKEKGSCRGCGVEQKGLACGVQRRLKRASQRLVPEASPASAGLVDYVGLTRLLPVIVAGLTAEAHNCVAVISKETHEKPSRNFHPHLQLDLALRKWSGWGGRKN